MSLPPVEIPLGAMRFNSDSQKLEYWNGSIWLQIHTFSPNLDGGARGVFNSGRTASASDKNNIDFITISTAGNAIDFGDSIQSTESNNTSCVSSKTRGLYAGGYKHPTGHHNQIGFITISSTGNSTDFGDLTQSRRAIAGVSNATRGCFCGGLSPTPRDTVDYVTIATTANAVDFGNLTLARRIPAAASSPTRSLIAGGLTPTSQNVIDFVEIATKGNAQDFGDLTEISTFGEPASDSIRGVRMGGVTPLDTSCDYINIATRGNAVFFGSLLSTHKEGAGMSNAHGGV